MVIKFYPVTEQEKKIAILLRCPDVRFPRPHNEFIKKELNLKAGTYYSLKRAGGVIALARPAQFPESFRSLIEEISLFVELHPEISHIIGINHEDCKKYSDSIDRNDCPPNPEREDLLAFAKLLTDMFPDLQIGAYYGRFKDETQKEAGFETIFETDPEKSLRKQ
jgi:hypothetical protein